MSRLDNTPWNRNARKIYLALKLILYLTPHRLTSCKYTLKSIYFWINSIPQIMSLTKQKVNYVFTHLSYSMLICQGKQTSAISGETNLKWNDCAIYDIMIQIRHIKMYFYTIDNFKCFLYHRNHWDLIAYILFAITAIH